MSLLITDYTRRFAKLHTDISRTRWSSANRYRAPHKPLLLLAVMDLFAEGNIASNLIELTPDLGELFTLYWALVMPPDQRGNIALPFFHLKNDGFWNLIPKPNMEAILTAVRQIRSINQLHETIIGAQLDENLYELLCAKQSRDLLRTVLIENYFDPQLQSALVEQGDINLASFHYSQKLLSQTQTQFTKEKQLDEADYHQVIRDQGFRRAVVSVYDHRCALCGIRMLTPDGHTAVDAAHIIPWSISYNDDPRNGMALCRLCHWTFDEGLLSVSSSYLVIVSPQLATSHNVPGHLATLDGRGIIGPIEKSYLPDKDALGWHRGNVFRKR